MKLLPLMLATILSLPAAAADWAFVDATVLDHKGEPVQGAVVYALSADGETEKPKTLSMDMRDMDFEPDFAAVTVGDSVSFPNKDATHHHVYSFSKVKKFDSRLYKDGKPKVVVFDKPGLVTVGCKIHDWMRGTILVTASAARAVTDAEGKASLKVSAQGKVRVGLYHPRIRGKYEKNETDVALKKGRGSVAWTIKLKGERSKKSPNRKVYY